MIVRRVACVVLVLLLGKQSGIAQEAPDRGRFLRWSYQDAGTWIRTFDGDRLLKTGVGVAVLVPLSLLDEDVSDAAAGWGEGVFGDFLDASNKVGSMRAVVVPAGIFVASLVTRNPRFQDAAFTSLQAVFYANAVTFALKFVTGRARPFEGEGAFRFDPFTGRDKSFPSGHTTTAFAMLSPWVFYYPNVATYSLLILATGTAVARLEKQKHWLTDVLAGAAIGISTGCWLSRTHQRKSSSLSVLPIVAPRELGIAMQLTF